MDNYNESENFHGNNLHVSALFRIAGCYENINNYDQSTGYLNQIIVGYPDTLYAENAQRMIDKLIGETQLSSPIVERRKK